jgi:hypothetical protein
MRLGTSASLVGALLGLSSGRPLAGETAGSSLMMESKIVTTHQVRAVVGPSVFVDAKGVVHLTWVSEDKEIRTVWYARTDETGGKLGQPVRVNRPEEIPYVRQEAPAIVVNGETVLITWAVTHPRVSAEKPFANDLRLSRSTDGGRTFEPSIKVNDDEQVIGHSFDSMAVGAQGASHIAWIDGRDGKKEPGTYVTQSQDTGRSVIKNLKIDEGTCVCCRTSLVAGPDGTIYVAWRKIYEGNIRETVVARSTDGGATYSAPVIVGHDRWVYAGCPHRPASLSVDRQGRLYVVWYTEGEDETPVVFLATSDDRAQTFSPKIKLNVSKGTFPDHPQLAVDAAGGVVVVWEEQSPVRREVVMSVSVDRGRSFSKPVKLNDHKGQAPTVSVNAQGQGAMAWLEHAMPGHKMVVQPFTLPPAPRISSDVPGT